MPKSRTNSIASRSGTESGGAEDIIDGNNPIDDTEMAERIRNRLSNAGTVHVNVESRTRGRMEDVEVTFDRDNPGIAHVHSESGQTYTVDYENGTCDCMHFRIRHNGCRHLDAVNIARGQIIEGQVTPRRSLTAEEVNTAVTQRMQMDIHDEIDRSGITFNQEDDDYFYSEHEDHFNEMLDHNFDVPYEYDNVLNGNNITFGLELEFVNGNADEIASELYRLGICAYDNRVGYHAEGVPGKWKLERDGSVSSGSSGGEIVSPVLRDTPETWRTIEKICEVAKRYGARINTQCGGHVHVGMDSLDTARQRWRRFFKLIGGYEECLYRFAGGDLGRVREGHYHYAMPISDRARSASVAHMTLNDIEDVNRLAENVSEDDRYYGVNLTNIPCSYKPNTVEFRYFNGTLNPKQIQANVKVSAGIMMAAEKARTKDVESDHIIVSENMKKRGRMLKETVNNTRENSQMMRLVDMIFTRKKDKDAIINVFAKNRWRED